MISLMEILKEENNKPKAIILAGGAGSGKSYIINNTLGELKNNIFIPRNSSQKFLYLNPDDIVEKRGISIGEAMKEFNEIFSKTIEKNQNIIWDTTGSNIKNTIEKLPNYNKFMVMVYTHPIISILQNKKRDRRIPINAVISTWNNVYSNIKEYKNILGNNFTLLQNIIPGYEKEIQEFNQAAKNGKESLKQYLKDLIEQDPEGFRSTFSKPFEFENKNIENAFEKTLTQTSYSLKDKSLLKSIKKEYEAEYKKKGEFPNRDFLEKKLLSARKTQERNDSNYNEDIESIINKLFSPQFNDLIKPNTPEEVQQKLKNFSL